LTPTYTRTALNPDFFARWNDDKPGMMRDNRARETYAQFFSLDNAQIPIIPGSSLRGMTRELIEIAGFGKSQWVNEDDLVFRAVGDPSSVGIFYRSKFLGPNKATSPNVMHFDYPSPQIRGGYLRITSKGYVIQPAAPYNGETFIHVEYTDVDKVIKTRPNSVYDVFVAPDARKTSSRGVRGSVNLKLDLAITSSLSDVPKSGLVKAKLVVSGHMRGGHAKHWHCAIYEPDSSAKLIPIPERLWQLYTQDWDRSKGRHIENDYDPLFYLVNSKNELEFFGPTEMFRIPYGTSSLDFVPASNKARDNIDLAEAIFGYVTEEKKAKGLAGRVFFTDAVCVANQKNIWMQKTIITPKILGSPKPTTFQHYLVQDKKKHDPNAKLQLAHYGTPTPEETVIRGYKLYWHKHEDLAVEDFIENEMVQWESDTQHTQIKPVSEGIRFSFRIYFENLTDVELGALLWVLDLPEGYHHKIGMGKPLGLGSVSIVLKLIITNRSKRYSKLFNDDHWNTGEDTDRSLAEYKKCFENYVLKCMNQTERGSAATLSQVSRIQMLLKILQWPGPEKSLTNYMEIEPQNKKNEFRDRPVLPDPLNVESYTGAVTSKSKMSVGGSGKSSKNINFSSTGKSAEMTWLQNIAGELKISLDDLLKKRPQDLPKRWMSIQESGLKRDVLNEIVAQLKTNGIWDNPPTRKLEAMVEFFKSHIEEGVPNDGT
jgi:CRISPR-associated protein (TIGR03986 family)